MTAPDLTQLLNSQTRKPQMVAEFNAALPSVKILGEIVKAAHELKDSAALAAAVNEVHGKLSIAYESVCNSQEKRLALQQLTIELEQEIASILDWKHEAERYMLTKIGQGVVAFTVKPGFENGEPAHKLCTACYGKRLKGYLQLSNRDGKGIYYKCNVCGTEVCCFDERFISDYDVLSFTEPECE